MFSLVVYLLCLPNLIWAQGNRGAIAGTVLDASGAVVPDVPITITDLSRGLKYPITSTGAGNFVVSGLTVGDYRVEAQKQGFKGFVQEPVTVLTGSTTTVNITLEVGAVTQQVSVTGSTPLLQTTDAQVSNMMSSKMYRELPLALTSISGYGSGRRQPEQFILFEPGVTSTRESDILNKTFNGSKTNAGLLMIDGVVTPNSMEGGQFEFASPPYEAMEEFKVQTSNLPAGYGGGAAVENLTMRSGTNNYHGDLFEFARTAALNGRGQTPTPIRSKLVMNEFGGVFGGPVVVPKVYNGHNRTFFFVTAEKFSLRGGPPSRPVYTVPTAAERQGDFSALLQPANGGIVIYDPSTTTFNPATGKYVRQAFPNNIITPMVSQATYWLPWIASPNLPGSNGGLFNNFQDTVTSSTNDWVWSAKFDHSFNDRNRITWSYWGDDRTALSLSYRFFTVPATPGFNHGGGHRLHYYASVGPNMQNDAFVGYTQYASISGACSQGSELGDNPEHIPNLDYYNPGGTGAFRWYGSASIQYFNAGANLNGCWPLSPGVYPGYPMESWHVGDTLSDLRGRHNMTFGLDASLEYNTARESAGGWYQFAGLETAQPGVTLGDAFASFLLGYADYSSISGPNVVVQFHNPKLAGFAQDEWKATTKFTVNYGLRYDVPWVTTESFDRMAGLDPLAPNPGAGNLPGAMVYLGSGPGRTGTSSFRGVHASRREFQPRLGFAYAFDSKTVIRGGYSLTFTYGNGDAIGFDEGGTPWQNGIAKFAAILSSPDNGVTPATTLQGGLPIPSHSLPITDPTYANGGTPMLWDPNSGTEPYIQQWTFGIQRYLPGNFFVSAAYVGNKGTRLTSDSDNWDQLPVSYMTTYGTLLTQPYNSAAAIAAGIKAPYAGFSGSVGQSLRPFPQYSAIADRFDPDGLSRYDALQMSLRKQMGDFQLMLNFTGQKALSNGNQNTFRAAFTPGSAADTHDLGLEKALLTSQPTRRLTASWLYEIPVGKGKRFASKAHGVGNQVIGGWELAANQEYADGLPLSPGGGVPNPIFNTTTRPNLLSGVPLALHNCSNIAVNSTVLYNINAFASNNSLQLGTAPPVLPASRGCAWLDEDVSVLKQFPISERVHLEFRSEFYNLFNRTKWASPSMSIANSGTFGKIAGTDSYFQPRIVQFAMKLIW
jgi:hypothetical protein